MLLQFWVRILKKQFSLSVLDHSENNNNLWRCNINLRQDGEAKKDFEVFEADAYYVKYRENVMSYL